MAIIPLSGYLGRATEEIASYTGPTLGGLLNATLGNLAELIIAILALRAGLIDLVEGVDHRIDPRQPAPRARRRPADGRPPTQDADVQHGAGGLSASLLIISVIGLVIPAVYHCDPRRPDARS